MTKELWKHPILNNHKAIGIDIDGTLINGVYSNKLQRWVEFFHDEIDMHLITFRDDEDVRYVDRDLGEVGIPLDWFKGVHNIPAEIIDPFNKYNQLFRKAVDRGAAKLERALAYHKVSYTDWRKIDQEARMWKGYKCHELGLTALIDDLPNMVLDGCEAYEIEYINVVDLEKKK
jgi:hypothetical protein